MFTTVHMPHCFVRTTSYPRRPSLSFPGKTMETREQQDIIATPTVTTSDKGTYRIKHYAIAGSDETRRGASRHHCVSGKRQLRRPRHVDLPVSFSPLNQQVAPGKAHSAAPVRQAANHRGHHDGTGARAAGLRDPASSLPDDHPQVVAAQNLRTNERRNERRTGRQGKRGGNIPLKPTP